MQVEETTDRGNKRKRTRRTKRTRREREEPEEEEEAADAALNHVIVERFNWSKARSVLRWREDEITGREGKGDEREREWAEGDYRRDEGRASGIR